MTLADRLTQAQQQSVALYLQLTQLEQQRQQIVQQMAVGQQALVKLDGVIETLTQLLADAITGHT